VTIARTATATLSLDASGGVLINPSLTTTFTSVPASTLGILVSSSYTLNFANANLGTMVDFKPTILFQQAGNGLGSGTGFNFEPTVKNVVGNAVGIGLFTAIAFNPTFTADTQTIANMGTAIGFIANPATSVANAGVITTMTLQGFRSQASIGASTTIGTLTHFLANNASGSGAVTTQLGFDIGALAKATTNIGIRIAAMTSPVQMSMFTTGPETANLTSNTNVVMTMYHGATNYYLLFAWNDAGTVRYKYFQLNGTGTTWAQGTTLPT
jgi:hypothetical protein